jgi:hypothetical protein
MVRIYDATARVSGLLLAGGLHTLLTSPASRWFRLAFEDPELQDVPEFADWLQRSEDRIASAIQRPEANFHAQMSEVYTELVFFGTAAVFIEDRVATGGIRFSTRPLQELYLAEDASGRIDTIFRKFKWTARQAVERLGKNAPEKAHRLVEKEITEEKLEFVHAILPNQDFSLRSGTIPIGMGSKRWESVMISVEESRTVSRGGFRTLPIAISRWQKEPWEVYGRGPGWTALPDAQMLNEMKRVTLKAGQRAVDPPLLVDHEGVLPSDLHVDPGGIIPVNVVNAQLSPPVQPLQSGSDFQITDILLSDTRRQVQDAFHHRLVELIRDPNMTATQVLELSAQVQRHMAPIMGRQQTEMLEPILERTWEIEQHAGRLPPAPPQLEGRNIQIDYVSPLMRSQRSSDAQAIINLGTIVANLAQVDRSVLDVFDADVALREVAQALGVPPRVLRSSEQIELRRTAAAMNAEEEAQDQKVMMGAEVAQKGASALKDFASAQGGTA